MKKEIKKIIFFLKKDVLTTRELNNLANVLESRSKKCIICKKRLVASAKSFHCTVCVKSRVDYYHWFYNNFTKPDPKKMRIRLERAKKFKRKNR